MYSVVLSPNQILRTPARLAVIDATGLAKVVEGMKQTLLSQKDPEGVGLAANQVSLPYRLFIARFSTKKAEPVRVFINPEIIDHSEEFIPEDKKSSLEGCLSLPGFYGYVKRWKWVVVKYQKLNIKDQIYDWVEEKFENFAATVIQHEIDHLGGKIFVERILEQKGKLYKVTRRDEDGKEIWEEADI